MPSGSKPPLQDRCLGLKPRTEAVERALPRTDALERPVPGVLGELGLGSAITQSIAVLPPVQTNEDILRGVLRR